MRNSFPIQTRKILPIIMKFKEEMDSLYKDNLDKMYLYGSYARGEAHPDSDVDILLVLHSMESPYAEISHTSDITYKYLFDHELNITLVPTTTERFDREDIGLYRNVKREGFVL